MTDPMSRDETLAWRRDAADRVIAIARVVEAMLERLSPPDQRRIEGLWKNDIQLIRETATAPRSDEE